LHRQSAPPLPPRFSPPGPSAVSDLCWSTQRAVDPLASLAAVGLLHTASVRLPGLRKTCRSTDIGTSGFCRCTPDLFRLEQLWRFPVALARTKTYTVGSWPPNGRINHHFSRCSTMITCTDLLCCYFSLCAPSTAASMRPCNSEQQLENRTCTPPARHSSTLYCLYRNSLV
jgi:hypothetical protein